MYEFKLPDLGEGVHEGQVVNVLVKEGDAIAEYQPMLEVETDKAAVEIPAPKAGTVARVHVQPGQTVKVGQVLISIDESGDGQGRAASQQAKPAAPSVRAEEEPRPKATERAPARAEPAPPAEPHRPAPSPARPSAAAGPARASAPAAPARRPAEPEPPPATEREEGPVPAAPAVRKLARELGVDIDRVRGSGPGGRIVREDVERVAAQAGDRGQEALVRPGEPAEGEGEAWEGEAPAEPGGARPAGAGPTWAPAELPDFAQYGPVRREAVPQIRKTIARQMMRAWQNVARVTHADYADVTDLERNRKAFNGALKEGQAKLTMTAIIVKAVAAALRDHPKVNASYDAATDEVIFKDYRHIGIAVDTPRGLVVPVLRDADRKPLPQVAAELNEIGQKARNVKFEIADLRGATFTITNVGALGGVFFTPMVNFPEVAILGVGAARPQAVVREGQIVPRLMLPLSLSFDHRIVDGADAARFVNDVISSLENPLRLISLG